MRNKRFRILSVFDFTGAATDLKISALDKAYRQQDASANPLASARANR